jgi:hypothetical protein
MTREAFLLALGVFALEQQRAELAAKLADWN